MPRIKVKELTKYFGRLCAVKDADLDIRDGEYVVLLGPSGCGKTTLLKMIAGTVAPSSGKVKMGGRDVTHVPPEDRHIGFVFQNYALFPHMNALDNASYGKIARGENADKARRQATEMLELVHLGERLDAYPREMSGGMQQRLALARAFATGSKVVLLDEPTNALDAYLRAELRNELRRLAKELGLTVIHVTHDQEEALALADKVVIMRGGRILQVGTPHEAYFSPASPFVANFLGEANFLHVNFDDGKAVILGHEVSAKLSGEHIAVIRPEHFDLGEKGAKMEIVNKRMLGPFYKYTIDCEGMRLSVRSTKDRSGATHVSFNPKNVMFFKEPHGGLEKSLLIE